MVRHGSVWCGVAQYGAAWLSMVRRGSVGSASACWKAGPSLILGSALAMSNQRSFKIESIRFAAFVPKKIEYIRFGNKLLDRNKTFSISTRKSWPKSFSSGPFQKNFLNKEKFCFVFKKSWRNLKRSFSF
jgi:hypothetical protein